MDKSNIDCLPEYKTPEGEAKTPEDRMLRTLYKFAYDLATASYKATVNAKNGSDAVLSFGEHHTAERFYLMLHGFFHNGK